MCAVNDCGEIRFGERAGRWALSGPGAVSFALMNEFLSYLLDRNYSPRTVRAYAHGLEVDLREADAQALEFPDQRFDSVLFSLCLSIPDDRRAVAEGARVLKPGGRLLLMEHVRRSTTDPEALLARKSMPHRPSCPTPGTS